ncbi:hypothetical protein CDL12_05544 [Handroanthus impetiginosus]|uniref:DUF7356 domain-containing protein n=1 Tax=Handroanthus impetiginosus TaxID=429701 RepID=A0A2G9HW59_9LAMI|nr:hypothetical protein CDL12_05544 [Handroanthus impetiginosus]
MKCLRLALLVVFFIFVVPLQSNGYVLENFRKLAERGHTSKTATDQVSPSSSPVQSPVNLPKGENCDKVFDKCVIKDYSITACFPFLANGSRASFVLVVNDGETNRQLNMTVRPANISVQDIEISGHKPKKVNLPSNTTGTSSILVSVENRDCIIQIRASIPKDFYIEYLTPINGTYLVLVAALFIGGTWTCFKLVKTRHLDDGVPYQELEMENQESNDTFTVESPDGWDQNWGDDWDEEKAVTSPGANRIGKVSENGASSK